AHVRHLPVGFGKALLAERDQGGRAVEAREAEAARDQIGGDRLARAAADVQHRRPLRQKGGEPVEPGLFEEGLAAQAVKGHGVTLIEGANLFRRITHSAPRTASMIRATVASPSWVSLRERTKQASDFRMTPSDRTFRWLARSVEPVEVMSTMISAWPAAGAPSVAPKLSTM